MSITNNTRKYFPDAVDREIAELLDQGLFLREVAQRVGISFQCVDQRVVRMRARYWMIGTKLLTTYQRAKYLRVQKAFMEVEGI